MKAVIMAGGRGTRINSLFPNIPKPLVPLVDCSGISKPILEWNLITLKEQGVTDIVITVSYKAEQIKNYFGDGSSLGVHIEYYDEKIPLGNAGALFMMREKLAESFLLLNADVLFDIDITRFADFHFNSGALVTLFTHPNDHPNDSGVLMIDEGKCVTAWLTKEDSRPEYFENRVNAGLHIIDPAVLEMTLQRTGLNPELIGTLDEKTGKPITIDLDRQILKPLCGTGKMMAYDSPEYVKDMGTPKRYESVCKDFRLGIVRRKNLRFKQKAVFLDRDGTINRYVGFLRRKDDFELLPGVSEAIRKINDSGYLAVVVSNQPVVARGEVTFRQLKEIHQKMETLLGMDGAYLDAVYFCPHHPDKGYIGEIKELKTDCNCRKPKPGLLVLAAENLNIDLCKSWMIGDSETDILTGKNAKTGTILLTSGNQGFGADYTTENLLNAVNIILGRNEEQSEL